MATTHSYGATLKNNKTENNAVQFVLTQNPCLKLPAKEERKQILEALKLPNSFSRAYDLVLLPSPDITNVMSVAPEKWVLVELKTTMKKLLKNPDGFFFGATANEFALAEKLGDRYVFCFVSMHPESMGYTFVSAKDIEGKIKTKRLQYQINFR